MEKCNDDHFVGYFSEGFVSLIGKIIHDLKEKGKYSQDDVGKTIDKVVDIEMECVIDEYGNHPNEIFEIRQLFFKDPSKKVFLSNLTDWIYDFLKSSRRELRLDKKNKDKFVSRAIDSFFSRALELTRINNKNASLNDLKKGLETHLHRLHSR